MNDPKRMKQLSDAWQIIERASHEELNQLFKYHIDELEECKRVLNGPENRFNTYEDNAHHAMDLLRVFHRRTTGYNSGWVQDKFLEHCSGKAGPRTKYNHDIRDSNCFFITQMVHRGASETQAMKLLMRLRGDDAMTSGHLRELQDTYRDYKKIGRPTNSDLMLEHNAFRVAEFIEFTVDNLEGEEKASIKAVEAFRTFMQDLIDLMKANHTLVAEKDSAYPDIFGCTIDWLNSDYEDPLDYFYKHPSHQKINLYDRRRGFSEYLNTMFHYMENSA